jgi:hypothetical protein
MDARPAAEPVGRGTRLRTARSFGGLRRAERVAWLVGAVLVASGLVHLAIAAGSDRPWDGPLSWRKPATFGLSFGLTLISVAWVTRGLRLSARARAVLLGVFTVDCGVEVLGITVQAWRHVPSHFNTETPFDATVAFSLAAGGAVLVAVLGTFAVTAFRGRVDGPPSVRLALRAGFGLLLAGLAAGVAMIARGEILIRSGNRTAGYDDAGFLKLFHGVTLHAVLVLPLLAWWLGRRPMDERRRIRAVAGASAGYVLAAVAVLIFSLVRVVQQ